MSELTITQLSDRVRATLEKLAAKHGRTVEDEARALIEESVTRADHPEPSEKPSIEDRLTRLRASIREDIPCGVDMLDELLFARRLAASRGE